MSKGDTTETDVLAMLFNKTSLAWDAATTLDVNLHTGNPGEAGTTATSLADYGGPYAAVVVNRNSGGWTVAGNQASNTAAIEFPVCTSGTNAITYVSICPHGSTQILYSGALNGGGVTVSTGIQPRFAIGALTITED